MKKSELITYLQNVHKIPISNFTHITSNNEQEIPDIDDLDNYDPLDISLFDGWGKYECAEWVQSYGNDVDLQICAPDMAMQGFYPRGMLEKYFTILRELHPDIGKTLGFPEKFPLINALIYTGNQHLNYIILLWTRRVWAVPEAVYAAVHMYEQGESPRDILFWIEVGFDLFKYIANKNTLLYNSAIYNKNLKKQFFKILDSQPIMDTKGFSNNEYVSVWDILDDDFLDNILSKYTSFRERMYLREKVQNLALINLDPECVLTDKYSFWTHKTVRRNWYSGYRKAWQTTYKELLC